MAGYNYQFHEGCAPPAQAEAAPAFCPHPQAPSLLGQPLTSTRFALLDTESTGSDPTQAQVIELAARIWFLDPGHKSPYVLESYVNPQCKIPPASMAVHHITNRKVENAPLLGEVMPSFVDLIGNAIPVAYNSEFDRTILRGTPLHNRYWVDVYRLAMKTWSIGELNTDGFALESFKQQELRYWLGLRDVVGEAHRAAADIFVTGLVFQAAVSRFLGAGMPDDADRFLRWLEEPIMHKTIPFGPSAGKIPEDLEDYELRRAFDPANRMRESLVRFNVLDFLRPEMMRRALSELPQAPRARRGGGVR